ncbi:hypothetical protein AOA12_19855 [Microbacterium sp. No. 7]|nr:hypothetical protein AOA12_19855 [Microbacterium sp. No. 7]
MCFEGFPGVDDPAQELVVAGWGEVEFGAYRFLFRGRLGAPPVLESEQGERVHGVYCARGVGHAGSVTSMDDGLDDAQQPRCPECGTVLVEFQRALQCRWCELIFVGGATLA